MERCSSINEGLPTLLTGNIIAFVTIAFEEVVKKEFSFRVLPVIFPNTKDHYFSNDIILSGSFTSNKNRRQRYAK